MKKTKKTKLALIGVMAVCGMIFSFPVKAEETTSTEIQNSSVSAPAEIPGAVNCFDYYKFGSVQVDIQSETATTAPGVPLTLSGKIKNDNSYPVVDGAVYVKVFKKQKDQGLAHANGNLLVDQFFAKESISLLAKSEQDVTFNWQIPTYATAGDYQIVTFFTSAKKFNLLGLSFTDDIVGNTFNFAIVGENTSAVIWDKNTVAMNDKPYHFATFTPKFTKDEPVAIEANLVNTTKEAQNIPVTWTLYAWDSQQERNILDTKTETATINPGEIKELSYQITDNTQPVYYIVAEVKYKNTKSILDMRFGRFGVDKVRLNFPAVTGYPLIANQSTTLFTCLYNSGVADKVDNSKLILTLIDQNNNVIHTYSYGGSISGAMMGLKEDFTPKENYSNFTLKAQLYTDNKLVDEAEMKYDCQNLGEKNCQQEKKLDTTAEESNKNNLWMIIIIGVIAILLLISIIAIVMHSKKRTTTSIVLLAIMFGAGMAFGNVGKAEAKSVAWNETVSKDFGYSGERGYGWIFGLSNPNFAVTYNVKIKNAAGTEVGDGTIVSVGDVLKFEPQTYADTDIFWFGTGHSSDSPYGHWIANATKPTKNCDAADFVATETASTDGKGMDIFIPFSVNPPAVSITQTGTAKLKCDASNNCTVVSPGTIIPKFNFASTYGKLYYRMNDNGDCFGPNDAIRACTKVTKSDIGFDCAEESADFQENIPAQTITYNLTATAAGNPPTAPVITGPATGAINTPYAFSAVSTDPDNDTLRYGLDWDSNGTVDQWMPAAGFVPSGTSQSAPYIWTTIGRKTIRAKACDSEGNCSAGWGSATINIAVTTSVGIDGVCGNAQGNYVTTDTAWRNPACSVGAVSPSDPTIGDFLTIGETKNWQCLGSGAGISASCSATRSCVNTTCVGSTTWSGICNGACDGGTGTELGACNGNCGTPFTQSRACVNKTACSSSGIKWMEL